MDLFKWILRKFKLNKIKKFIKNVFFRSTIVDRSFSTMLRKYIIDSADRVYLIDIGANKGAFYDEFISILESSHVEALLIEPIPKLCSLLKMKYSNNIDVIILQEAVSELSEKKNFFINQFDETSSLLQIKSGIVELNGITTTQEEIIKVSTKSLDSIMTEHNLCWSIIDLLKIDVQGTEDKVIFGAKETLKKTRFIWIEVSFKELYNGSCLFSDIHSILANENFILVEIIDGYRSEYNELIQANCLYKNMKINILD
jgi:FkbM family methyltransferase